MGTQTVQLIDPTTLNRADVTDKQFWKESFNSIATTKQMIEFTVMDIDPVSGDHRIDASMGNLSQRHILADAWVVRSNTNDDEFEKMKRVGAEFPDVVLVKKVFADRGSRMRRRKWKLKHLDRQMDDGASSAGEDYEDFLQDLEEDETIRQGVNIFVDKEKLNRQIEGGAEDDDGAPEISLAEMMEDLEINDDPMGDADGDEEIE